MQNTKVPSQHTSWSAMTRSSWKCGLTVCTRFSINQLYIFQFDKMVCRHVFHVILLSWHGKLFSCCSRWRGSNFHSQVQASGVEVLFRVPNRLLKARETWNLSSGGLALEQQSPHCRKYFFPKYNVLKKTCKFAFFLFSKVGSHAIFCYDTFPEIPQREGNLESYPWALNTISNETALDLEIKICAGYLTSISLDRAGSTAQYLGHTFNSGIVQ